MRIGFYDIDAQIEKMRQILRAFVWALRAAQSELEIFVCL